MSSNISPELAANIVPASELHTHPDNSNIGDRELIKRSLEFYGQIRPILALPDGTICAGNHTFVTATKDMGWDEVAVVYRDMSPRDALTYLEMDNMAAQAAAKNKEQVIKNLEKIQEWGGDYENAGYTQDNIDDILDELASEDMQSSIAEAGYAETDEQRDARDKSEEYQRNIEPKVEVMLMMTVPERVEFVGYLAVLRRHYGIESAKECVVKCVKETAMLLENVEGVKTEEPQNGAEDRPAFEVAREGTGWSSENSVTQSSEQQKEDNVTELKDYGFSAEPPEDVA